MEIRTILEKMRPVEHKLKYQIEKLLKLAAGGKLGENDPLQFKANPNNLMSKVKIKLQIIHLINQLDYCNKFIFQVRGEDSSDDDDAENKKDKKSGVYVPPKIASMHYGTSTICYECFIKSC